jgi:hypothetical protein
MPNFFADLLGYDKKDDSKSIVSLAGKTQTSTPANLFVGGNFFDDIVNTAKQLTPQIVSEAGTKVAQGIGEFAKGIGQSIARSFLATGVEVKEQLLTPKGERKQFGEASYTPQTETEKKIFGTDKPVNFKSIGEETLLIGGEDFAKKWGSASIPLGVVMAGLDVIPSGGDDAIRNAAKVIAKTEDVKIITNALKNVVKGSDEEIKFLAKSLTKVNKADEVVDIIKNTGKKVVKELQTSNWSNLQSAVNRLLTALKEAKPIRAEQEAIYSAKKAQQAARASAMGKKVSGEAGYFAQLGQLKGEMSKVSFESIRKELNQNTIDELFDTIEKNNILTIFEKINAKHGLSKLLGGAGGTIPTNKELELLNEVFPPEFTKTILDKRPMIQKVMDMAGSALNLPRAVMATMDLSAPLRQGVFLIGRLKQFLPAFRDMFKYAFSERAYTNLMEAIKSRPTYRLMRESNLALTDLGPNLLKREEAFMSNLVEKIPIFGKLARGSNRAYSGFLNKLRADVFDDLVKNATNLGILKKKPNIINDIARFVNSATGRGDLGELNRASVVLNGAFFSPRLMASRLNLLNPAYYGKLDPFVRKEALKSLLYFGATAGSIVGLAKLGGLDVGIDPRSADFGKMKTGNTRFDPWGGFQQYIVLISRLLSGKMVSSTTGKEFTLGEGYKPTTRLDIIQRFAESKTSPVASFVLGLLKGQTSMGEKFRVGPEIADRFIPMVIQDMYDLYREMGPKGILAGIPGVFGVGSQTYSDLIPLESKTPTGKPTIEYRQQTTLGEDIINKITGKKVEPVPVKAKYDEVQILLDAGKKAEAQKIVDSLSDNDYALYKKLKQRDERIRKDEIKARIVPIYKEVRKLIEQGKGKEAADIVEKLSDEEYDAYKSIKSTDYKTIQ